MAITDSRTAGVLSIISEEDAGDPTDVIRTFVSATTGLPLDVVRKRYLRRPGTRPSLDTDWCSVYVQGIETKGSPLVVGHRGQIDAPESGFSRTETHQTISVSVEFYGVNAPRIADRFRDACGLPQNGSMLARLGLQMQGVEQDIRRLPDFAFEQWCDRFEVRFRVGRKAVRKYGIRDFAIKPDISLYNELE